MEEKYKNALLIGISTVALIALLLSLTLGIERMISSNKTTVSSQADTTIKISEVIKPEETPVSLSIGEPLEWKDFSSEVYKFKLQYPTSFLFDEDIVEGPTVVDSISFGRSYEAVNGEKHLYQNAVTDFLITVIRNDTGLEDAIKQGNEGRSASEKISERIGTEKIAGHIAEVIKACDLSDNCEKIVYFTDKKYVYSIQMSRYFTREKSEKEIFDKMLMSLNFE